MKIGTLIKVEYSSGQGREDGDDPRICPVGEDDFLWHRKGGPVLPADMSLSEVVGRMATAKIMYMLRAEENEGGWWSGNCN